MSENKNITRATDENVASSDSFIPDAIASEWIEQLSAPYRERPWAVIRELFQNASDSFSKDSSLDSRIIEFGLLSKDEKPKVGNYHFVIRDSGIGMDDDSFCRNVGILGQGSKKGDGTTIGQFGVGFYSTNAICVEVAIISKTAESSMHIGWKYSPGLKTFFRMAQKDIDVLLSTDFQNHPIESRKRNHGTSVYLNIDFDRNNLCLDWLSPESVLIKIKRDFFIIPASIFIIDLSDNAFPKAIRDLNGNDVSNLKLNLSQAPWEVSKAEKNRCAVELLKTQLPYSRSEEDLPKEWGVFKTKIGKGSVAGFLYLVDGAPEGFLSLCLKRMWVELANDCKPLVCDPVFGVFNIEPGEEEFDIQITAQRDHIIRDSFFEKARLTIEDACVDFLEERGEALIQKLQAATNQDAELNTILDNINSILRPSTFFSIFSNNYISYFTILSEVPREIKEFIKDNDCPVTLMKIIQQFVKKSLLGKEVNKLDLSHTLESMQEMADRRAADLRKPPKRGSKITWNPRASKRFLEKVGKFLPITLAIKERKRDGGFNVRYAVIPLIGVTFIDPASINGVDILLKGNAEDYLSKNRQKKCVIIPTMGSLHSEELGSFVILLAILGNLKIPNLPELNLLELTKELFQEIQVKDNWLPIIDCFDKIVNGMHRKDSSTPKIIVEALGFQGTNAIPLLFTHEAHKQKLVINAYNSLMKDIQTAYSSAARRNDEESKALIVGICHELYHHTPHVEGDSDSLDSHEIEVRNQVYSGVLDVLQKYIDLKG